MWPAKVATAGALYGSCADALRSRSGPVADVLVVVTTHNSSHVGRGPARQPPGGARRPRRRRSSWSTTPRPTTPRPWCAGAATAEWCARRTSATRPASTAASREAPAPDAGAGPQPRRADGAGLGPGAARRAAPPGRRHRCSADARRRRRTGPVAAPGAHPRPRAGAGPDGPAGAQRVRHRRRRRTPSRGAVDWAVGAACWSTGAATSELGGWDESFFLYSEETDFCLRAPGPRLVDRYEPRRRGDPHRRRVGHQSADPRHADRQPGPALPTAARRRRAAALYWSLSVASEATWVVRGHPQSRAAIRALLRPTTRAPELGCSSRLVPR